MWANVGVLAGFGLVFLALTAVYFLVTEITKRDANTALTA